METELKEILSGLDEIMDTVSVLYTRLKLMESRNVRMSVCISTMPPKYEWEDNAPVLISTTNDDANRYLKGEIVGGCLLNHFRFTVEKEEIDK